MALGTPVAGAAAYSTQGGTTVAPAYPAGILATDAVLLFVGQKPSTANGGTVTTPTGWTLRDELTGAGGYGTTVGIDTGNTNLRVYSWNTPVAGQTGTLSVTYSYGQATPPSIKQACVQYVRAVALRELSDTSRDVIQQGFEGGSTRYSTPDWAAGRPTGQTSRCHACRREASARTRPVASGSERSEAPPRTSRGGRPNP